MEISTALSLSDCRKLQGRLNKEFLPVCGAASVAFRPLQFCSSEFEQSLCLEDHTVYSSTAFVGTPEFLG